MINLVTKSAGAGGSRCRLLPDLSPGKRVEAGRRNKLGVQAMSREEIDQANNVLQTVEHQLAKAVASRDLARLDLQRTEIRAPLMAG